MRAHGLGLLLAALLSSPAQGAAHLQTETLNGTLAVETWKARRDARVVKQDADYSCGAASLATLLTHYYRRPTTEKDILDLLTARAKDKAAASFEDLAAILPALGYAASEQSTLNLNLRANVSGSSGAEMGLTWLYKLGKGEKGAAKMK